VENPPIRDHCGARSTSYANIANTITMLTTTTVSNLGAIGDAALIIEAHTSGHRSAR
jgi:hypothetical protein